MPFSRPTLSTLVTRIESDILSRVETGVGVLRRSILRVFARVFGAAINLTYGYIDYLAKQLFVATATGEWLEHHGLKWGKTRRQATYSTGAANVTGASYVSIPGGTSYFNSAGIEYKTAAPVTIIAGVGVITVTAITPGAAGNVAENEILTIGSPIEGIDAQAFVDADGIRGGEDIESDSDFRKRILFQIKNNSMGGSETDIISWTLDAPSLGVTRVWTVKDFLGFGTVGIFFVLDNQDPIFPNASNVAAVQAILDAHLKFIMKPFVYAPTEKTIGITIHVSPDNADIREAVKDSLVDMFRDNTSLGQIIYRSQLDEAISLATGEVDHLITAMAVDGSAHIVSDISIATNELPTIARDDILFE